MADARKLLSEKHSREHDTSLEIGHAYNASALIYILESITILSLEEVETAREKLI